MQKQTAKMKSTRKTGQEEPELKKSTLEKSQPWRKVNGQSQRKSTVWSTSWSTMTSANWRVTSADDVAVMTSPRADVSRWTPGVCRHVGKSDKAWRRMTVRDGMWSAWAFAQNILATREGAWELRWWLGFHDRVDRRRKILIVPAVDIKILWWIHNRLIVHDKIFAIKLISNWWRGQSTNEIKPRGEIKWRKPYGSVRRKDLYGKFLLNEISN